MFVDGIVTSYSFETFYLLFQNLATYFESLSALRIASTKDVLENVIETELPSGFYEGSYTKCGHIMRGLMICIAHQIFFG